MLDTIEFSMMRPEANQAEVEHFVEINSKAGVLGICIPPWWIKLAKRHLGPSHQTRIICFAGYPYGFQKSNVKILEAEEALDDGADEVDLVLNISALKTGMLTWIKPEIARAAELCHSAEKLLKVVIETALVNESEMIAASKICLDAGADYIKTGTGLHPENQNQDVIGIIRKTAGNNIGVCLSQPDLTIEKGNYLIDRGADRLSTSLPFKFFEKI
jgi:deoxyribose-phosphate aldolase